MKQNSIFTVLVGGLLFLSACGKETDTDKIAEAQTCLDTATAATAATCVEKVDGLYSQGAYLIRCAGKFVVEGYNDSTKLATAMNQISGNTGSSGSTAMMAALAFTAEATTALNSTSAQQAFEYCTLAKSKGLILLSGLAQTSSVLADLAGDTNLTGAELQALMGTQQNNPVAQAAVGSAVAAMYTTNCTNSQSTTGAYCEQFESALANVPGGITDTTELGKQIMICYNAPATAGCEGF
jgi:hypothetical protein